MAHVKIITKAVFKRRETCSSNAGFGTEGHHHLVLGGSSFRASERELIVNSWKFLFMFAVKCYLKFKHT